MFCAIVVLSVIFADMDEAEFPPTPITPTIVAHEVKQLRTEVQAAQNIGVVNQQQSKTRRNTFLDISVTDTNGSSSTPAEGSSAADVRQPDPSVPQQPQYPRGSHRSRQCFSAQ
jgi:hypothetical protein